MDIEALLKEGNCIQIHPQGYSMYPLLVSQRDEARIEPVEDSSGLKRGEVALFRRDTGLLVLHRICSVKADGFYFVGDNQKEIEGPISPDQILGRMIGFVRKGKYHSIANPIYQCYARLWLLLRPMRPGISKQIAKMKHKTNR